MNPGDIEGIVPNELDTGRNRLLEAAGRHGNDDVRYVVGGKMIRNIDRGKDAHHGRCHNPRLGSVTRQGEIGGALRQTLAAQHHIAGIGYTNGKLLSGERG